MAIAKPNTEQLLNWGPKLASGLLVVSIAYASTQLVWLFSGSATTPVAAPKKPMTQHSMAANNTNAERLGNEIVSMHLFGESEVVPVDPTISAPETKLNLKLVGILAIGGEEGLALIASGGRKEKVFKVGDKLPGNATLKAVYADKVLLQSNRGLETLKLPKKGDLFQFNDAPRPSSPLPSGSPHVAGKSLGQYRQELIQNPSALAQLAQALSPEMGPDGRLVGYKMAPKMNDPLYAGLGLQANDIITSVNGVSLDRPENIMRAMQRLRRDKSLEVSVLRGGNQMTLEHQID